MSRVDKQAEAPVLQLVSLLKAFSESRPIQRTKPARCGAKPHRAALSSGRARAPTLRAKRGMFMNRVIASPKLLLALFGLQLKGGYSGTG